MSGSDDEGAGEKKEKKKVKKAKKVVKKKEKKEKEPSPPKLKLDMGDSKPKVSKAKMFEQSQKEEKPLGEIVQTQNYAIQFKNGSFCILHIDNLPPKKKAGGKLTGGKFRL